MSSFAVIPEDERVAHPLIPFQVDDASDVGSDDCPSAFETLDPHGAEFGRNFPLIFYAQSGRIGE